MTKYFLASIAILSLLPMVALAAPNTVTFTEDTNLYLWGLDITVVAKAGSAVTGITVNSNNISLDMESGSYIHLSTTPARFLVNSIANTVCESGGSFVDITSPSTQTVVVTIGSSCTSVSGGVVSSSGGGGGGSSDIPPSTTTVPVVITTTTVPVIPTTTTTTIVPVAQMTVPQLQAEVARITALIAQLQQQLLQMLGGNVTSNLPFLVDLQLGMKNNSEVKRLQEFLISKGYLTAGLNTGNYYQLTANAVAAYQLAKGITPTNGRCGPKTRAAINIDIGATQ